jgi:hypothetical protein
MDFGDERYVRVFVRDTPTMKLLRWEGRMVFFELLRKVDRAGVMDFGDEGPAEAIAAVTDIPLEHVTVGLRRLLDRGCVVVKDSSLVIVKFLEAQESPQSDKHRQRESRAKRRDLARHGATIRDISGGTSPVTERDSSGTKRDKTQKGSTAPSVTNPVAGDTNPVVGDTNPVETVTLYRTVPYRTISDPTGRTTAKDLTPLARDNGKPEPEQQQQQQPDLKPAEPEKPKPEKVPCPTDLWERMPERTKLTLDTFPMPRQAQEYLCRGFAARYAGRSDQIRTLEQWVSSAVRAIQSDWNDPNKRPKIQAAEPAGHLPPTGDGSHPTVDRLFARAAREFSK